MSVINDRDKAFIYGECIKFHVQSFKLDTYGFVAKNNPNNHLISNAVLYVCEHESGLENTPWIDSNGCFHAMITQTLFIRMVYEGYIDSKYIEVL